MARKLKNVFVYDRQRGVARRVRISLPSRIIHEHIERWEDGIMVSSFNAGNAPSCCGNPPEENGLFLCDCPRHIVRVNNTRKGVTSVYLTQILELPEVFLFAK